MLQSKRFPNPIELPQEVFALRKKRNDQIVFSSKIGIGVRVTIIFFELIGVFLFNSSSLFMDAIASSLDVISSLFLIFCIRFAQRPPDKNHPFGHGRSEPLGGLLLGLLLVVTGGVMFVQQAFASIQKNVSYSIGSFVWLFPLGAMILLEACYRFLIHVSKKENSPALKADAVHYRIDGLTSLFAMIALVLASYWPNLSLLIDHLGALVIALFMIGIGVYSSKDNLNQLMDKVPDQSFFDLVKDAAFRVVGVKGTEKTRIQIYGPDAHVDIDIEVEPQLSVEVAHKISQRVRAEIQKAWPAVLDVTVHIEPYYANDH